MIAANALRRAVPLILVLAASAAPAPAGAVIRPAQTIDGPSRDVLELGGVAMAPDGSGGIAYRKVSQGRAHIFVARFGDGRWFAPRRVDNGQAFDSSWPRIAAGNGGRLLVSWVQEGGVGSDRLYAASLDPGATLFEPPAGIDLDVNEASATWPALAMNGSGQALIVYRVVTNPNAGGTGGLPLGYEGAELRLARYNGTTWSSLGVVSRRSETPVRPPDASSAPRLGIDASGGAIVAFVEPDDALVDRLWARRVFSSSSGPALQASPATLGGKPVGPVDAFDLGVGSFGEGAVAYRQAPAPAGSAIAGPRILVARIPELFATGAASFAAPAVAEADPPGAPSDPAVSVSPRATARVAFARAGTALAADIDDAGVGSPRVIASPASSPLVTLGPDGVAATAWRTSAADGPRVGVEETLAGGTRRSGSVSVASGAPVADLRLAGSRLGDALVAFRQGEGERTRIAAGWIDVAPGRFATLPPLGWVRPAQATFEWEPAPNAIGDVTYAVSVDGQVRARGLRGRSFRLPAGDLDDGRYRIQAIAVDAAGQRRLADEAELRVDSTAPGVTLRIDGRRAAVRVDDGPASRGSGVRAGGTRVSFGDGGRATGGRRVVHRYARGGAYRVVISVRDRAGNARSVSFQARVR